MAIKLNGPRTKPAELEALLARAQTGDERALQTMQSTIPHLDAVIAESYDDAAERVEATLIARLAGQDLLHDGHVLAYRGMRGQGKRQLSVKSALCRSRFGTA